MPRKKTLTPAEALERIKELDVDDTKAILCVLVGAWAGNPQMWASIAAVLGKPTPDGERIATA